MPSGSPTSIAPCAPRSPTARSPRRTRRRKASARPSAGFCFSSAKAAGALDPPGLLKGVAILQVDGDAGAAEGVVAHLGAEPRVVLTRSKRRPLASRAHGAMPDGLKQ